MASQCIQAQWCLRGIIYFLMDVSWREYVLMDLSTAVYRWLRQTNVWERVPYTTLWKAIWSKREVSRDDITTSAIAVGTSYVRKKQEVFRPLVMQHWGKVEWMNCFSTKGKSNYPPATRASLAEVKWCEAERRSKRNERGYTHFQCKDWTPFVE